MKGMIWISLVAVLVAGVLCGCNGGGSESEGSGASGVPPGETQRAAIVIDGFADDWEGLDMALNDPHGDGTCGLKTDIRRAATAMDSNYAYFMLETWRVPLDISNGRIEVYVDYAPGERGDLDHGGADLGFMVHPDRLRPWIIWPEVYDLVGSQFAVGEVVEVAILL